MCAYERPVPGLVPCLLEFFREGIFSRCLSLTVRVCDHSATRDQTLIVRRLQFIPEGVQKVFMELRGFVLLRQCLSLSSSEGKL